MTPETRLQDKVALVTGASRGIGRAIALCLARLGADVAVASRGAGTTGAIDETVKAVQALGRSCVAFYGDLSVERDVESVAQGALARFGRVDILVNNAAAVLEGAFDSFWDMTPQSWRYQIDLNLTGYWLMTKQIAPQMRDRGGGIIVNITSGATGEPTNPDVVGEAKIGAAYPASKEAVTRLTSDLGREFRDANIAIVAIHPGVTRTDENIGPAIEYGYDMTKTHGVEVPIAVFEHVVCAPDPLAFTGQFLFAPRVVRELGLAT